MDDVLIYLLLGLIYLIFSRLTSKKKKKKQPAPPLPLPGSVGDPVDASAAQPTLDDALREIRVALGMDPPSPPPVQVPPRKSTHPTRSHGPELAETAPKKSWSSEFKPIPTHYADETFEELRTRDGDRFGERRPKPKPRTPATTPPQAKPARTTAAKKHPPKFTTSRQAPSGIRRSKITRLLKDPYAAREAFVLSEIFGPPYANRRR